MKRRDGDKNKEPATGSSKNREGGEISSIGGEQLYQIPGRPDAL